MPRTRIVLALLVCFSLLAHVENSKAYYVSPGYSSDQYCAGSEAYAFISASALVSPDACADAAAADAACGFEFYFGVNSNEGQENACACIRQGQSCTVAGSVADGIHYTIYSLVKALYIARTSGMPYNGNKPDYVIMNRLKTVASYVDVISDEQVKNETSGSWCTWNNYDLIVVSGSVVSWKVGNRLKSCTIPVVILERRIYSDFGMSLAGVTSHVNTRYLDISPTASNAGDRLAAGLSGHVEVFHSSYTLPVVNDITGMSAAVIAATVQIDGAHKPVMFYYNQGDSLADGTVAAGIRISSIPFFEPDDSLPNLTNNGIRLLEASLQLPFQGAASVLLQATSTESITATTTSIAPPLSASFVGEMVITVTNAADFVEEPNVTSVMTRALAASYNVSEDWIKNVIVSLRLSRRLSSLRRRMNTGEVDVRWEIDIPPSQDGEAIVRVYAEKFNAKAISEITVTINTFLNSGVLEKDYVSDVKWVYVVPEEDHVPHDTPRRDEDLQWVVISTVCVGVVSLALVIGSFYILRRHVKRSTPTIKKRKKGKPLVDCNVNELLNPPRHITKLDSEKMHALFAKITSSYVANLSKSDHRVCVTYAVGQRDEDVEGFGPGSYYAAAVAKVLNFHGVPCLFDMMMEVDQPRAFFSSQLTTRADCKVLIVVQTKALHHCKAALKDIYIGQKSSLKLLPLRFEADLPSSSDSWPTITREDLEGMLMVSEVQHNYCKLNSTPSPPYTVCNQPNALLEVAHDLQRLLNIGPSSDAATKHMESKEMGNACTAGSETIEDAYPGEEANVPCLDSQDLHYDSPVESLTKEPSKDSVAERSSKSKKWRKNKENKEKSSGKQLGKYDSYLCAAKPRRLISTDGELSTRIIGQSESPSDRKRMMKQPKSPSATTLSKTKTSPKLQG